MQKAGAFEVISKEQSVQELYAAIQRAVAAVQPVLIMEETPASISHQTSLQLLIQS